MSILDVADRNIITFHIRLSCTGEDTARILKLSFLKRQLFDETHKPTIHSDNGTQFISEAFEKACEDVKVSM